MFHLRRYAKKFIEYAAKIISISPAYVVRFEKIGQQKFPHKTIFAAEWCR